MIAAIMRAAAFSPNHIGNDAAILNAVAEQLRKRGLQVHVYSEEHFIANNVGEDIIVNMCRDPRSIAMLQQAEDSGKLVINSGYGIENCTRERLTRILMGSNFPYPPSLAVNTNEVVKNKLKRLGLTQCWIKRADTHAMHKEDVSYVRYPDEAQDFLQEYFMRGIGRAVISKHMAGDLVKFYGVLGQPFFYWFCPFVANGGSYSCTALNEGGKEALDRLDARLRTMCPEAAAELNLQVYGGDCVIGADATPTIISFNDWPSFSPCRAEASTYIAKSILASIKKYRQ